MKLILKHGINEVRFGMTPVEVKGILGNPDREIITVDDEPELIWEYTAQRLRLSFYEHEDGRLGYLRCSNPALTIGGHGIIEQIPSAVMDFIDPADDAWAMEDFDNFITYFHEGFWLTLNVEYE